MPQPLSVCEVVYGCLMAHVAGGDDGVLAVLAGQQPRLDELFMERLGNHPVLDVGGTAELAAGRHRVRIHRGQPDAAEVADGGSDVGSSVHAGLQGREGECRGSADELMGAESRCDVCSHEKSVECSLLFSLLWPPLPCSRPGRSDCQRMRRTKARGLDKSVRIRTTKASLLVSAVLL